MPQQLPAPSLHRRRALPGSLAQNFHNSVSKTRLRLSHVSQSLKSKGLNNGTAVFQITAQQTDRGLLFPRIQAESWNHDRQMPAQLLFLGLSHQAEQLPLIRPEQLSMFPRDLLGRVRGPHSHQPVRRPQTCNQFRKKLGIVGHHRSDPVRVPDRPSISSAEQCQNISSHHTKQPGTMIDRPVEQARHAGGAHERGPSLQACVKNTARQGFQDFPSLRQRRSPNQFWRLLRPSPMMIASQCGRNLTAAAGARRGSVRRKTSQTTRTARA